ncbi:2399_t:CDS:2, partial [Funneliformis geosporum]
NGEKLGKTNQSIVKDEKRGRINQSTVEDEKHKRINQSTVKNEKRERTNQLTVEKENMLKKMTSAYLYSESYEDSYGNVNELNKASKDHTHNSISNLIPIYDHISIQIQKITSKRVK